MKLLNIYLVTLKVTRAACHTRRSTTASTPSLLESCAGNWSPTCAKPTTNEHRAAKAKTGVAKFPSCSASMCVHLRLKTGSSRGTGRATSSKASVASAVSTLVERTSKPGWPCTSAIHTARGSEASTRTPTAWFVSTCPRARICRSTATVDRQR